MQKSLSSNANRYKKYLVVMDFIYLAQSEDPFIFEMIIMLLYFLGSLIVLGRYCYRQKNRRRKVNPEVQTG